MAIGWTTEIRQAFFALIYHPFPSTSVPGDGFVLDVASPHYCEKHSATSTTTVGRFVALIVINGSDR